jgi:HK97 family phage prohead protease
MISAHAQLPSGARGEVLVEGYASLFGLADQVRDIVRAGAFRVSLLQRREPLPMLVEHESRLRAGHWHDVREDRRGLFVRGAIAADAPGAQRARRLLSLGGDGLSIGFVPVVARCPVSATVRQVEVFH